MKRREISVGPGVNVIGGIEWEEGDLNVRELLTGVPNRLRFIRRYNTAFTLHNENVAEHVFYTSLYGMMIVQWCWNNGSVGIDVVRKQVCMEKVLSRCVLHDLEESLTGDIDRNVKRGSPDLYEAIKKFASRRMGDLLIRLWPQCTGAVSWLAAHWNWAKDETYEGRIVQLADFMSVVSYMHHESLTGQSNSLNIYQKHLREYYAIFESEDFDFVRPIVDQVKWLVDEITAKGEI